MANTLGGINLAQIANESLSTLLAEMQPLNAFTTDFSSDVADKGESVSTRVATAVTAGDATSGYSATDVTSTAKTVSLSNHVHFTAGFTDLEISKGGFDMLERTFIRPAVHSVANKMMDDTLALVTNANFSNNTVVTSGNFDADDAADLAKSLTTQNTMKSGRSMIIGPAYYAALAKDNAIQAAYAFGGSEAIRENEVPRVHGFDVYEYTDIPDNSENLEGIVCSQEGVIIAARQPSLPQNWFGDVESVTEPGSGLTLQYRSWYEGKDGKQYITCTLIYGVAVGVSENVHRILSA